MRLTVALWCALITVYGLGVRSTIISFCFHGMSIFYAFNVVMVSADHCGGIHRAFPL